jgi:hypothetical protein
MLTLEYSTDGNPLPGQLTDPWAIEFVSKGVFLSRILYAFMLSLTARRAGGGSWGCGLCLCSNSLIRNVGLLQGLTPREGIYNFLHPILSRRVLGQSKRIFSVLEASRHITETSLPSV